MKKLLASILALAMSVTLLAGCEEVDSSRDKNSSSKADASSVVDDSSADDSSVEDSSVDDSSVEDSSVEDSSVEDSSVDDSSIVDSSAADSSKPDVGNTTFPTIDGIEFGSTYDTAERRYSTLVNNLAAGNFTMDMTHTEDGMTVSIYVTANKNSYYLDMNMGISITMLTTGNKSYYLDNEGKKYYEVPKSEDDDLYDELIEDFIDEDVRYVSTCKATVDGKDYVTERYLDDDGEDVYFMFDGDNIAGVIAYEDNIGAYMYLSAFVSAKTDSSKLSLPSSYTAMTDQEFTDWYSSLWG